MQIGNSKISVSVLVLVNMKKMNKKLLNVVYVVLMLILLSTIKEWYRRNLDVYLWEKRTHRTLLTHNFLYFDSLMGELWKRSVRCVFFVLKVSELFS